MPNNNFDKELILVNDALSSEEGKKKIREYLMPLVRSIAEKYASGGRAKNIDIKNLVEAGLVHLPFAMKKYVDHTEQMKEGEREKYMFSTYFTWFIRQGIIEYLKSEEEPE